jgi:hypothetical protein
MWTEQHARKHLMNYKTGLLVNQYWHIQNSDKPFELEVDASGFAIGAVLLQKKEDGKRHPIMYYSKTLNKVQQTTMW